MRTPSIVAWHHQGAAYNSTQVVYSPCKHRPSPTPISGGLSVRWSTLSSTSSSLGWFGRIVERGSNSNGEYVRWDDGTQVCWDTCLGERTAATIPWTYPAAFIDPIRGGQLWPSRSHPLSVISWSGIMARTQHTTQQVCTALDSTIDHGSLASQFIYIAIGRWK